MRTIQGLVLLLASTLATVATAQTGAVNPQSPARRVDSVRPLAKVKEDAARLDALLLRGLQKKGEQPLPEADLKDYVAFSASAEGRRLNAALFAGFDAVSRKVSSELGRAAAEAMTGNDI